MAYNTLISRDASNDPLVPTPVAAEIIDSLPEQSAIMSLARRVPMSTKTNKMPVLDVLPMAYWVSGDTGLKQTSTADWKGIDLVAEEIAAIIPIPEAYLDDAQIPIWEQVKPKLAEAIGAAIDAAALFGTNKPSSWPAGIYYQALQANNWVKTGTAVDQAADIAAVAEKVALDGYNVNGFASRPGLRWRFVQMRTSQGVPIYHPDLQSGVGSGSLYGYPLAELTNGGWDASEAELIAGDWSKAILGVRQDITFKMFDQGVISDDSGNVVLNLMQQDSVAIRVVMRVAFATANPATRTGPSTASARSPFGVLQATTANS